MGSFSLVHWLIVIVVAVLLFGGRGKISQCHGRLRQGHQGVQGRDEGRETHRGDTRAASPRSRRRAKVTAPRPPPTRAPAQSAPERRHGNGNPARCPDATFLRCSDAIMTRPLPPPLTRARRRAAGRRAVRAARGARAADRRHAQAAHRRQRERFRPSPKAVAAMAAAAARVNWYCDPEGYRPARGDGAAHGVARDNIVLGTGIDDLLGLIVRSLRRSRRSGGDVARRLSDLRLPRQRLRRQARHRALSRRPQRSARRWRRGARRAARGSSISRTPTIPPEAGSRPRSSWRLIARLPDGLLLVLDEAYADFAPAGRAAGARSPRTRASSACAPSPRRTAWRGAHRLRHRAGGDDPHLRQDPPSFRRQPPGAGRRARLARRSRLHRRGAARRSRRAGAIMTARGRARPQGAAVGDQFRRHRLGTRRARQATCAALLEEEARFLRMPGVAPLDRCIRVTVGTAPERAAFAEALRRVVAELPG